MANDKIARKQVERSFRKFNDIADDLQNAHYQTWNAHFSNIVKFCESDAVMRQVTEPLRSHPVDVDAWYRSVADLLYTPKRFSPCL